MRERLAAVLTVSLVAGALVAATGAPPDCVVFAVIGDNGTGDRANTRACKVDKCPRVRSDTLRR